MINDDDGLQLRIINGDQERLTSVIVIRGYISDTNIDHRR
jgi:hypothetical protein